MAKEIGGDLFCPTASGIPPTPERQPFLKFLNGERNFSSEFHPSLFAPYSYHTWKGSCIYFPHKGIQVRATLSPRIIKVAVRVVRSILGFVMNVIQRNSEIRNYKEDTYVLPAWIFTLTISLLSSRFFTKLQYVNKCHFIQCGVEIKEYFIIFLSYNIDKSTIIYHLHYHG